MLDAGGVTADDYDGRLMRQAIKQIGKQRGQKQDTIQFIMMEKGICMDKKTVSKLLENAGKEDLIGIISQMSRCGRKAEQCITDWCISNNEKYQKKAIEMDLERHWEEAREVIQMFNEYGGGPESDEGDACDHLWKMDEIVKSHDISWEKRVVILDEMLEEFFAGNSGFDDILIQVAESFCLKNEEKRYLADALSGGCSGYYRGNAAQIYKSIGDQEQFLKTKLANLQYGSDYVEIARYYAKEGNQKKELEYIWKGLEACTGRLDELIDYVAPIYIKEKNDAELKRLHQFVLKTKWDFNIFALAKHLYRYADEKGDYQSEKQQLLLILDTCDKSELKKWFGICKEKLQEEDWQENYEKILEKIRNKDLKFYLDICMENGREEIVLKYLQSSHGRYNYWDVDYNQYFSKRLAEKYPNEILELYWEKVNNYLHISNNKNYELAVSFLKNIKTLMKKNDRQAEWEAKFRELKDKHKRKRNFMDLLGSMK